MGWFTNLLPLPFNFLHRFVVELVCAHEQALIVRRFPPGTSSNFIVPGDRFSASLMSIVHAAPATAGGLLLLPRRLPPSQASASLSPTPARAAEPQHPVPAVAPPESLLRPETVRKCPHAGLYATALTVRPANLLSTAPCAKGPLETMVSSMAALSSWLWSHRPRPAELGGEPSASAATPSNLPPLSLPMTTGGMLDWPRLDVDKLPRMVAACAQRCIHRLDALERDLQRPLDPTGAGLPDRVRATTPFDWVLQPVTAIQRELALVWGVLNHLLNVRASPALRRVYDAAIPQLMALEQRLLSSRTVHAAVAGLRDRPEVWARLDSVQRRAVEVLLQDAELAGVQLSPARQKLLNTVRREGTQMSSEYAANLLQTGQAWHLTVEDRRRMAGMPHAVWALAAAEHRAATGAPANPDDGPWRLTLNVAGDVLCLAEDRQLREAVLTAFCQKGLYTSATPAPKSSLGGADNAAPRARYAAPPKGTADGSRLPASPFPVTDNSQVVRDLLTLRQLEAGLLGFDSYADLSVHYKMARRVARAQRLLNQTRLETWAAARRELQTLQRFAQEHGLQGPLQPWDISYYTTLLTRRRFHFTEADVAAYFPFPRVVQLLATVCRQVRVEALPRPPALRFTFLHSLQTLTPLLRSPLSLLAPSLPLSSLTLGLFLLHPPLPFPPPLSASSGTCYRAALLPHAPCPPSSHLPRSHVLDVCRCSGLTLWKRRPQCGTQMSGSTASWTLTHGSISATFTWTLLHDPRRRKAAHGPGPPPLPPVPPRRRYPWHASTSTSPPRLCLTVAQKSARPHSCHSTTL